jgi:photosystem II stability/assembly factor-like uncharacterized protein
MISSRSFSGRHWLGVVVLAGAWSLALQAAEWQPVTTELLRTSKPGYGGLCGVVVDHKTGNVIVNVSDQGFFRSEDQGKTWKRLGTQVIKGRTEWPGCLMLDPVGEGKTLVSALVYGQPIVVSRDGGSTWREMDGKSRHVDWCAVDWSDPDLKFVLTLKHESGGLLLRSEDGGQHFSEDAGKGYGPAWIFDSKTAVVAQEKTKDRPKPSLLRTTDGGKTFTPCADYYARALPRWHKESGSLYWLAEGALLNTTDKGENWKKVCDLKDGRFGPIFGKDGKHFFVLTKDGIIESSDGGTNWSKPIAPPADFKGIGALTWIEYDPVHDVLYLMKMTSELYRLERGK